MATSQIELEINLGILRNIFPRNIDTKQVYSDCIPKDIQSNDITESKDKRKRLRTILSLYFLIINIIIYL